MTFDKIRAILMYVSFLGAFYAGFWVAYGALVLGDERSTTAVCGIFGVAVAATVAKPFLWEG